MGGRALGAVPLRRISSYVRGSSHRHLPPTRDSTRSSSTTLYLSTLLFIICPTWHFLISASRRNTNNPSNYNSYTTMRKLTFSELKRTFFNYRPTLFEKLYLKKRYFVVFTFRFLDPWMLSKIHKYFLKKKADAIIILRNNILFYIFI